MAESSESAWPQESQQLQISSTMPDGPAWPEEENLEQPLPLLMPWSENHREQQLVPVPWLQQDQWQRLLPLRNQEQLQQEWHTQKRFLPLQNQDLPLQNQEQQTLQDQDQWHTQEQLIPLQNQEQQSQDQEETRRYLGVPGIRFVPSDIELILDFLRPKLRGEQLPSYMHVCDVYSDHPKELTSKLGPSREGNWYMFSPRNRKYNKGKRPSRSTGQLGFWKSTTKNEAVLDALSGNMLIGYKACLTYHEYDESMPTPKLKKENAIKTPWKMWEFVCSNSNRPFDAEEEPMRLNDWVLCKVTNKDNKVTTKKFKPQRSKKPKKPKKLQQEEQPQNQGIVIRQPSESGSASSSHQEIPGSSLPGAGGDAAAAAVDPMPLHMIPPYGSSWNYFRTGVTADGIVMDDSTGVDSYGCVDGALNFARNIFYHR
uniref:NAC domain-containing protein n=1 Tax=Oryza meridionalis TaxID=40149 RepID=A0A0E0C9C2_9ORYZ